MLPVMFQKHQKEYNKNTRSYALLTQCQTMCCVPIHNVKMTEYNPETDGTKAFKRISIGLDWNVWKRRCMEHHFVRAVSEVPSVLYFYLCIFAFTNHLVLVLPETATPHPPGHCGLMPGCQMTHGVWLGLGFQVAPLREHRHKKKIRLVLLHDNILIISYCLAMV